MILFSRRDLRIARYQVSANPDVADETSEKILLTINHQDMFPSVTLLALAVVGALIVSVADA